jgi:hypothetical protein
MAGRRLANRPRLRLALSEIVAERGAPVSITVDNGTEFQSKTIDVWSIPARSLT